MKIIEIFGEEHLSDCSFGRADGTDDFFKDCDCYEELLELKKEQELNGK